MELRLFEVAGETYTRIKILRSQYHTFKNILKAMGIANTSKESSRYVYFEVKGDLLNKNKEA